MSHVAGGNTQTPGKDTSLMTLGLLCAQSVLVVYVAPPGDMHPEVVIVQPVMDFEKKKPLPPNYILHFSEGDLWHGWCESLLIFVLYLDLSKDIIF